VHSPECPTERKCCALHTEAPSSCPPPYFFSAPLLFQSGALYYRLPWTLPEGVTTRLQTSKGQTHHWPAMQKSHALLSKQSVAPLPLHNQLCISPSISPCSLCFAISLSKEAPSFRSEIFEVGAQLHNFAVNRVRDPPNRPVPVELKHSPHGG
jgi:hypothetical protein